MAKKKEVKETKTVKTSDFSFGSISRRKEDKEKQTEKENRRNLINELIGAPKPSPNLEKAKYTVEETEYEPTRFIVVITPKGVVYQEPVPRYFEYKNFVALIAAAPDKMVISSTLVDFDANLSHTAFEVKGVDCEIVTADFTGNRSENSYSQFFDIKNGTLKVGGNIIFAGPERGFTKVQAKAVVSQIIKIFDKSEEKVTC